jgi:hypothetical protein
MDTDGNNQLECNEIKAFIEAIINKSGDEYALQHLLTSDKKGLFDKDLRVFINYIDIDKSGLISKAEFLRQYTKMEALVKK